MNNNNLQQIFAHYIEHFDFFNNAKNNENFKWEAVKAFQNFDFADTTDFAKRLSDLHSVSSVLLDSSRQFPFSAICRYVKEPENVEIVSKMFCDLFADDGGDLKARQRRIDAFIAESEKLREKYFESAGLYACDQRAAMMFLFLKRPDENYPVKNTQAKEFADCVEFYDDWGTYTDFRLDTYYRMCNEITREVKNCAELLKVDATRFEGERGDMRYSDPEKHILTFDIIYCSMTYNLYDGIAYEHIDSATKRAYRENKATARARLEAFVAAKEAADKSNAVLHEIENEFSVGTKVTYRVLLAQKPMSGTVEATENGFIVVKLENGDTKKLSVLLSVKNGILKADTAAFAEKEAFYREVLKSNDSVQVAFRKAGNDLAPYEEFLD